MQRSARLSIHPPDKEDDVQVSGRLHRRVEKRKQDEPSVLQEGTEGKTLTERGKRLLVKEVFSAIMQQGG